MISVLKNSDGYIYSYCEWWIVDETGANSDTGNFLYVKDLWIHPKRRCDGTLKNIIRQIDIEEGGQCQFVFWNNLKHNRLTSSYLRARLKKLGE